MPNRYQINSLGQGLCYKVWQSESTQSSHAESILTEQNQHKQLQRVKYYHNLPNSQMVLLDITTSPEIKPELCNQESTSSLRYSWSDLWARSQDFL